MYEFSVTLLYLQTVHMLQYAETLRSAQSHPHRLVLPRGRWCGAWGMRGQAFWASQIVQHQTDAGL